VGKPVLAWSHRELPDSFVKIGNLKPSAKESKLCRPPRESPFSFGDLTAQPWIQWRWDHDQERFLSDETGKSREHFGRCCKLIKAWEKCRA
jgi:hypothetical protein